MHDVVITNAKAKQQVRAFSSLRPPPAMTVSAGWRSAD